jgi:hypothetical protein
MTKQELRGLKSIKPDQAAAFLGNMTGQYIRWWCQDGRCPFGHADRKPGSKRWIYFINVERLIQFKEGRIDAYGRAVTAG